MEIELRYFSYDKLKKLNIAKTHRHIIDDYLVYKENDEKEERI
jgi:hypothetical protein